jgi:hypothetical protein
MATTLYLPTTNNQPPKAKHHVLVIGYWRLVIGKWRVPRIYQ